MSRLRTRRLATGLSLLAVVVWGPSATATTAPEPPAPQQSWVWPLEPVPPVVRGFAEPDTPWSPGHRGVDLLGSAAERVLAIGAGDVAFARTLARRGVVVIRHGALRSTYEPVTAAVHVGEHVYAGQVIGLLQATRSHCAPQTCLHLGLRRGSGYLDPLTVLGPRPVRLKPLVSPDLAASGPAPTGPPPGTDPAPAAMAASRSAAQATPGKSAGVTGGVGRAQLDSGLVAVVVSLALVLSGRAQARG
jgi:Peptidase family M23